VLLHPQARKPQLLGAFTEGPQPIAGDVPAQLRERKPNVHRCSSVETL
jgi:hypothetical protein